MDLSHSCVRLWLVSSNHLAAASSQVCRGLTPSLSCPHRSDCSLSWDRCACRFVLVSVLFGRGLSPPRRGKNRPHQKGKSSRLKRLMPPPPFRGQASLDSASRG